MPGPVGADRKDVDPVFLDVFDLLPLVILDDDLIRKAGFLHVFDPRHDRIHEIQLSARLIEMLRRHTDDQIVAERLRPLEELIMSLMKEVEASVCDHLRHSISSGNLYL